MAAACAATCDCRDIAGEIEMQGLVSEALM
jgi:hypothetical protein